jgi:hypothetical protein
MIFNPTFSRVIVEKGLIAQVPSSLKISMARLNLSGAKLLRVTHYELCQLVRFLD